VADPAPLTPDERRWVDRLRLVMADQPDGLWLFAANGDLVVMRCGPNREHVMTSLGGVDPAYDLGSIPVALGAIDGGDW